MRRASGRGGARKKVEPLQPVPYGASILAAFQKQNAIKSCPICGVAVPNSRYNAHFADCKMKEDDSDCQVLETLTGSQSRARRAGSPIKLEEDASTAVVVGSERPPLANVENCAAVQEDVPAEQATTPPRRRSKRLSVPERNAAAVVLEEHREVRVKTEDITIIDSDESPVVEAVVTTRSEAVEVTVESDVNRNKKRTTRRSTRHIAESSTTASVKCSSTTAHPSTSADPRNFTPTKKPKLEGADEAHTWTATKLVERLETIILNNPVRDQGALSLIVSGRVNEDDETVVKATSPYFVRFVLLMMRKVLCTPKSDGSFYDEKFWGTSLLLVKKFLDISDKARILYMRMLLRKRAWLTEERLKQRYIELSDGMQHYVQELVEAGFVDNDKMLKELDVVLRLLPVPSLKVVAKSFKVDSNKGKLDLISSLVAYSTSQLGLFGTNGTPVRMLKLAKQELGNSYRIAEEPWIFFKALFTLYAPVESCSSLAIDQPNSNIGSALMYAMLRMDIGETKYPAPNPCETIISIYESRDDLYSYVKTKELEVSLLFAGSNNKLQDAYEQAESAYTQLLDEPEDKVARVSQLPPHLRRFTRCWVLMRCISHGASILEKQRQYAKAVVWQRFMLTTARFSELCPDHRGEWWNRLALNLSSHLKEPEEAMEEIRNGMKDDKVPDKNKLMLQDRAIKMMKGDFVEQIVLRELVKEEITGTTLSKSLGDDRVNRFVIRDESGDLTECNVEEVARRHYLEKEGFTKGVHAEGSIWHTAIGLLFYDILYDEAISDVWFSELQINPADLNSKYLYESRKDRWDSRLKWLETCRFEDIGKVVRRVWDHAQGETTSEINWELFENVDECIEFLGTCPRVLLVGVIRRVITDYRHCRSGFPDLTVWNPDKKKVAVIEVKGPGDTLSTKQRLWLDYFMSLGGRAEVCHVIARKDKRLE